MSSETAHKPIEWWNHKIKLDWGKLFSVIARTALKTASANFDEAWDEAVGGVEAFGVSSKPDPQVLAWLLINRALARSVFTLLDETRTRNPDLPYLIEGDGVAVNEAVRRIPDEFEIRRDFLNRPETLPFLGEVRAMLIEWFTGLGVADAEARALVGRLDGILPAQLREEWRRDVQTWQPISEWFKTPVDDAVRRQYAWDLATSKVMALPAESVFGEAFCLRDVYVPLRAYTVHAEESRGRHGEDARPVAKLGWLRETLLTWIDGLTDKDDTLRVISGGPGYGKSSAARMLAAEFADRPELRVLYVPLHQLRLDGELREALARYCKTRVFDDDVDPIDALEQHRRLVLFLDGLDELSSSEHRAAQDLANQFAVELRTFLSEQNQSAVRVLAIVGGRELAVQSTTEARFQRARVLHVFPFAWDDELRHRFQWHHENSLPSLDQRADWWRQFAKVTGAGSPEIPKAVRDNAQLLALTKLPLLNYLVASFERRHGDAITIRTSVADIYDALIRDVYERAWRDAKEAPTAVSLAPHVTTPEKFFLVLEEVALAVWHGNDRGATLSTIRLYLEAARLTGLLQEIQSKLEGGITNLLLAFFIRRETDLAGANYFEFTHKSFQEYLTARRILRTARELAAVGGNSRDIQSALKPWVEATGPAMVTHEIATFLDHEAGRDSDATQRRRDREALCFLFGYQLVEGLPVQDAKGAAGTSEDRWPTRYGVMRSWSDCAELGLLAVIAALTPRSSVPGSEVEPSPIQIALPHSTALKSLLERLSYAEFTYNGGFNGNQYGPITARSLHSILFVVKHWGNDDGLESKKSPERRNIFLVRACLGNADLRRSVLCGADLRRADLKDANLAGSDLSGANIHDSDIRNANLRGINFRYANLTSALLRNADVAGADFRQATLDGVDFKGAKNLPAAIFSPGVREKLRLPPAAAGSRERNAE